MLNPKDVLAIEDMRIMRLLRPEHFVGRALTKTEFEHLFRLCDAFWFHDGDPKKPHAELTSGKCSNGFIDCLKALSWTNICQIMAGQMVRNIMRHHHGPVDWVIGSDHAAAALSKDVANIFGARHDFTEKGPDDTQIWKRFVIGQDETVLHMEELMTTSKTALAVRNGVAAGNPNPVRFAPVLPVLVHRSDVSTVENSQVLGWVHYDIWAVPQSECPLCEQGSERLRPKSIDHWARLTGRA